MHRIRNALFSREQNIVRFFHGISIRQAAVIGLGVVLFLTVYPRLFPLPSQINAHDEASYIHGGYRMFHGDPPALACHPLVSAIFAGAYALLRASPWWFIQSEWLVRAGLFLGLWLCVWRFGRSLRDQIPEWVICLLWLLIPIPNRLLDNPSQLLFTILLTCALLQCVRFLQDGSRRRLWWISACLGCAFLTRSEGLWVLLLACPGMAVVYILNRRKTPSTKIRSALHFLAGWFLPFLCIVMVYVGFYWTITGSTDTRLATRSYEALEAGQGLSYPERYQGDLHLAGVRDSRSLYGTAAENRSSVVNAFLRNPSEMSLRMLNNIWAAPQFAGKAYGGLVGILVALFAVGGVVHLAMEKQWPLLLLFLSFSLFLIMYVPFFWLSDYFIFLFPVVFFLAAKGIRSAVEGKSGWLWAVLGVLSAGFLAFGVYASSLRFVYFGLVILALWLVHLPLLREPGHPMPLSAAVATALLLMSNPTYAASSVLLPDLQTDNLALAAIWLRENTSSADTVSGWGATMPYLAERPFLSLEGYLDSPAVLYSWLITENIGYLYQDDVVKNLFPDVYQAADSLVAQGCLEAIPEAVWDNGRLLRVVPGCALSSE
ncbi:MAG: hypothetical protein ACK2UB_08105 [Anaerolineales bacterium]